jgi:tRNA threonylcarbamoyladenosine biosynthesis protein TsaE
MLDLGERIAQRIPSGSVVYLEGDLGAGKTTLARGILRGMGHQGPVTSPTYTLLESYVSGACRVHHFDLYRVESPEELENIGIRDLLDGETIALVEWPDRGDGVLPPPDLVVRIAFSANGRRVGFQGVAVCGGDPVA